MKIETNNQHSIKKQFVKRNKPEEYLKKFYGIGFVNKYQLNFSWDKRIK